MSSLFVPVIYLRYPLLKSIIQGNVLTVTDVLILAADTVVVFTLKFFDQE